MFHKLCCGKETSTSLLLCALAAACWGFPAGGYGASSTYACFSLLLQVTLMAESFGCCLALRLAAAAPHLIRSMVLLNPATCYNQSLNGLSSLVSATNLLGLFPQDLYNTAQVGCRTKGTAGVQG